MNRRAALIGGVLALGGGLGMALRPRAATPVWTKTPLARLVPGDMPGWRVLPGAAELDVPVDDSGLVARTYGAVVARSWQDGAGAQVLAVIACAAGGNGGLLVHRPESCYPAAGFTLLASRPQAVPVAAGRVVPGRFLTARSADRMEQVLYWIRVGHAFPLTTFGQQEETVRAALAGETADGVLVRLSTVSGDAARAATLLTRFATDLCAAASPEMRALLADR